MLIFNQKVIHRRKTVYKRTEDPISGTLRLLLGCFLQPLCLYKGTTSRASGSLECQRSPKIGKNNLRIGGSLFDKYNIN